MSSVTSRPSIPELVLSAKKIVWKAKKEGTLKTLTPRIIRQTVEKQKSLEEGTLDSSEYKNSLKDAIVAAMNENPPTSDNDHEIEKKSETTKVEDESPKKGPPKAKKRSSNALTQKKGKTEGAPKVEEKADIEATPSPKKKITTKSKPKPKSKSRVLLEDTDEEEQEEAQEDTDSEEERSTAKKKRKTTTKSSIKSKKVQPDSDEEEESEEDEEKVKKEKVKNQKVPKEVPSKSKAKAKAEKAPTKENEDMKSKFKSLEHVPTSDMEQDEPVPEAGPSNTKSTTIETPVKKTPTKRKASSTAAVPTPQSTPRKKVVASTSKVKAETKPKSTSVNDSQAKESDTELSDLIDEPPKKKRKSSSGKEKDTKAKEKKKPKGQTLTKDEETIKRLKSLVVACGTRKVWSKVFQGLDTPQQQIKKLKEMLGELGMTGRYSTEQAKAIKEKREFEQELEDVKEFADKFTGRASRSRNSGKATTTSPNDGHESSNEKNDEDESDEEVVRRTKTTARKSIMAFLEDQSDEDE